MTNQPLLSICIPTYNRADVLDETLQALFGDADFDNQKIEVLVSDNASTDHTQQVTLKYPQVHYHRNVHNIKDANFTAVLDIANGKYLKLFNDTLRLQPGKLKKMLDIIAKNDTESCNLLFFNNFFLHSNTQIELHSPYELLRQASFYTTWIANFGVWRSDFEVLTDKNRWIETQFLQVDWLFRLSANGKPTQLFCDEFIHVVVLKKKGGYNVFDTFVNKYLRLIRRQKISWRAYELEKYRLFRYFLLNIYFEFRNDKDHFAFDLKGQNGIILRKYWYEPYLIPGVCVKLFNCIKRKYSLFYILHKWLKR